MMQVKYMYIVYNIHVYILCASAVLPTALCSLCHSASGNVSIVFFLSLANPENNPVIQCTCTCTCTLTHHPSSQGWASRCP